jgi:hypothetical protein
MTRTDILDQVASGTLSAAEAAALLSAPAPAQRALDPALASRWLRIRVTSLDTGRPKVSVNLPMAWVEVGLQLGSRYHPQVAGIDLNELLQQIESGTQDRLIEVEDLNDRERVEIFVE